MRLWFVPMLIVMAGPLRADPACEAVKTLGRLATSVMAADIGGAERELRRIKSDGVMWDLSGHPLAIHRRDIGASLSLATKAVETARMRGRAGAAAVLSTEDARATAGRLATLVSRHACGPVVTSGARGDVRMAALAGISLSRIAGVGAGVMGACTVLVLAAHVIGVRRGRNRRRVPRHAVDLPARLRSGTAETGTRLIDISRHGAKLRLGPEFEPAGLKGVTIVLGDRRIGATVQWRDRHHVGVQFLKSLPDEVVTPILTMSET